MEADSTALDRIVAVLREAYPHLRAAYVYGSVARGDATVSSDIDIAVLPHAAEPEQDLLTLLARLAEAAGRDVDLADLRAAGDVLRREVIAEGKLLYARDPDDVLGWEASALTRYGFYRFEIQDLLADFREGRRRLPAMNDLLTQKIASLQRCVRRARDLLDRAGDSFAQNPDLQDAAVLNVIRACDTGIDLANVLIRGKKLGIPADSRDSFATLAREGFVTMELAERLARMVGFRNIAVHEYRRLDFDIVRSVIERDLDDLLAFAEQARELSND